MIRFLKGYLHFLPDASVMIETPGGIGFRVFIPQGSALYRQSEGQEVELYTSMIVKEDSMSLYGFTEATDLSLFELMLTVSGIGAKGAMSIMSTLPPGELKIAIARGDAKSIARANGIGKKTAERLILELKDKVATGFEDLGEAGDTTETAMPIQKGSVRDNAVEALLSLGYSRSEATGMIARIQDNDLTLEEYIRLALRAL